MISGEKIIIRLKMDNKQFDPVISRNAIGELYGTNENVNESVVVLSGHIDSKIQRKWTKQRLYLSVDMQRDF